MQDHLTLLMVYSRWIRLLFGREFDFKDVLRVWDVLFAENLRSDIVDLTCVAMLLRTRWSLIESDYTAGITALTHYSLPNTSEDPRSLVRDAIFLDKNRDSDSGALLIQRYSGRRPKPSETIPNRSTSVSRATRAPQRRLSPSASPGRFASQQRQLEGLFRDVTGNLQKRTEGWDVSKAVRGAVGEVRRNINNYQPVHSRQASIDTPHLSVPGSTRVAVNATEVARQMQRKLQGLQERNIILARMLDDTLQSLRSIKITSPEGTGEAEENLNICLAKIQFVSVYLSDSDIPIPSSDEPKASEPPSEPEPSKGSLGTSAHTKPASDIRTDTKATLDSPVTANQVVREERGREVHKPPQRPSLMDASFSFMLGENRHRSSFVTSVADLPEQSRDDESRPRPRPKKKVADSKHKERKASESEDDGFTLTQIQGG